MPELITLKYLDQLPHRVAPQPRDTWKRRVIEEFLTSGHRYAEIVGAGTSAYITIRKHVRDNDYPVEVVSRNGKVYLCKEVD